MLPIGPGVVPCQWSKDLKRWSVLLDVHRLSGLCLMSTVVWTFQHLFPLAGGRCLSIPLTRSKAVEVQRSCAPRRHIDSSAAPWRLPLPTNLLRGTHLTALFAARTQEPHKHIMLSIVVATSGYNMQSLRVGGALRAGRAALSKLASPRMAITLEESGEFGTTDYTMTFKEVRLSPSS